MPTRADSVTRPQLDPTGEIPLFMRLCTEYAYLPAIGADGRNPDVFIPLSRNENSGMTSFF